MTKPRIFLSHSAKDPDAEAVLTAVADALEADGYEVLLDRRRLQAGQAWRDELHTWLALCHGAVVLFSKHAVGSDAENLAGSPWVLKEATILTWRRALDKQFVVVPVLLPPIRHPDLDRPPFFPLKVNEIQATAGQAPGEIAAEVLQALAPLKACATLGAPLESHERVVAAALRAVGDGDLHGIAQALGFDLDDPGLDAEPSDSREDLALRLTRRAFHADLDQVFGLIREVSQLVDKQRAGRLRTILLSFWVPPEAAASLVAVARAAPPRAAALTSRKDLTGKMYVQRACCAVPGWWIARATTVGAPEENLAAYLRDLLWEDFKAIRKRNEGEDYFDDDVFTMSVLESEAADGGVFAIITGAVPEPDLVALQAALPPVTFFILLDPQTDPDALPHLTPLRPQVSPDEEARALITYARAGALVR